MGIREKMNENPVVTGSVVTAIILIAIFFIYWQNRTPGIGSSAIPKAAFYTEDDGKTYFPGDFANLAKDFKGPTGKDALRAYVFRYGKENPFVAYLEKQTPASKQILTTFYSDPANAKNPPPIDAVSEALVKKPGDKAWVSMKDRAQSSTVRRVPPQGDLDPEPVLP